MKRVAISVGDLNGIGIELALKSHNQIKNMVKPLYMIDEEMLNRASQLLNIEIPNDFDYIDDLSTPFEITPSKITSQSGGYSFDSFLRAVNLAKKGIVDGIVTLPINKKAWENAGIKYKGHTDALRDIFGQNAIMMMGIPQMFVALYTEHIPFNQVVNRVKDVDNLSKFLVDFYHSIELNSREKIALLALNPHAGDCGILGDEERYILEAIQKSHKIIKREVYTTPIVPDIAFTLNFRKRYRYFVAMYHDQGLAPLKALYFNETINITLNLPIIRVSVGHGTAFDIAYKDAKIDNQSYINAIEYFNKNPTIKEF